MSEISFDFGVLRDRGLPTRRFDAGDRIFIGDDPGDCMYVVGSGTVEIVTFGTILDVVGPNGAFGEMALIDGGPRSASASAREPAEVALIDRRAFMTLVREDPAFALNVMGLMARRIRRMNESL